MYDKKLVLAGIAIFILQACSGSGSDSAQFLTLEDRADPAADIVSLVNLALPPAGSCSLESESPLFDPDPDLFFSFA